MDVEVFIVILRPSPLRAPSSSSSFSSSSIHASGRHVSNLYTVGPFFYLFIYFFLHAISPRVGYLKKVGWKIIEDRVTVASWKEICNPCRIMIKAFRQFGRLKAVDGEYQGMVKCLKVFGKFLRENRLLYREISFDISIIRLYIIRVLAQLSFTFVWL